MNVLNVFSLGTVLQFKRFYIVHHHINKTYNGQTSIIIVAMLDELNKQKVVKKIKEKNRQKPYVVKDIAIEVIIILQ